MTAKYEKDPAWFTAAAGLVTPDLQDKLIQDPPVHDIKSRRHNAAVMFKFLFPPVPLPVPVTITKHEIASFDGVAISVYQLQPEMSGAKGPSPAAIYAHGGGMISLSALDVQEQTASLAAESGVPFFSVDYRLAPESRHPGPTEDVFHALLWLHAQADLLNIDPKRIGVIGESAGGGIVAGVALLAKDRKLDPPVAKAALFFPMLDHRTMTADPELLPLLTWKPSDNITGWSALLGRDVSKESVEDIAGLQYASPARAESLAGMPDTYIDTGTLDLFHDEIVEYGRRYAEESRGKLEIHLFPGLPHGFNGLARNSQTVKSALELRNAAIQSLWNY